MSFSGQTAYVQGANLLLVLGGVVCWKARPPGMRQLHGEDAIVVGFLDGLKMSSHLWVVTLTGKGGVLPKAYL